MTTMFFHPTVTYVTVTAIIDAHHIFTPKQRQLFKTLWIARGYRGKHRKRLQRLAYAAYREGST